MLKFTNDLTAHENTREFFLKLFLLILREKIISIVILYPKQQNMKKIFIPILLISFCTIICGCSPKDPTSTNTEATADNPQIIPWDTETSVQEEIQPDENYDGNSELTIDNEDIETERDTPNTDTSTENNDTLTDTTEKSSTDEIIDRLREYGESWDFDEEWVDILYQIIDSLSE